MVITEMRNRLETGSMIRWFSLALLPIALALGGCGPPDMGVDKDAFKSVDALYTAVSLRDVQLVERCEGQLKALQVEGKLPSKAAASLEAIIAQGKSGEWEASQSKLASFMAGQRR